MTQDELNLVLDALKFCHGGEPCGTGEAIVVVEKALAQEQEPVAWQLWVGADTPLNAPMGWHFYSTYDSLKSAEISARTINSYQQAPFAKIVPLYTTPPQRTEQEPVKMVAYNCLCGRTMKFESVHGVVAPQRTWVGLEGEEIRNLWEEATKPDRSTMTMVTSFAKAIEAKLKEKNFV